MSWLARSIANSLRLEDDDFHAENDVAPNTRPDSSPANRNAEETQSSRRDIHNITQVRHEEEGEEEAQARGVKEDLTELKLTLTRQLWGVASFLAPPPTPHDQPVPNLNISEASDRSEERGPSNSEELLGIRHEFGEIGDRFREISKMASNYFPFGSEENEAENGGGGNDQEEQELETAVYDDWAAGAIGITDEVLAFARNIAMHPETWLDFPLEEEEDLDDFHMSDAQRQHALAIELLAPRLAALRIEFCPCHMTESYFWKVYFVLLHSRLNKQDAEILSTPQVMDARALWMQELHKQTKPEDDWFGRSTSYSNDNADILREDFVVGPRTFDFERTTSTADYEADKHPVACTDTQFIDKSVITEKPVMKFEDKDLPAVRSSKVVLPNYDDDEDDWPDEEDSDLGGYKATIPVGTEDDISFSDLEDDDNTMPIKSKILPKGTETSKS